jgi:hypothetical protein
MAKEIQAPESVPTSTNTVSDQPTFVDVPPTNLQFVTVEITPDEAERLKSAFLDQANKIGQEKLTQAAYNTVCKDAISVLPALIPTISWKKDTPKEYEALVHGLCK